MQYFLHTKIGSKKLVKHECPFLMVEIKYKLIQPTYCAIINQIMGLSVDMCLRMTKRGRYDAGAKGKASNR